MIRRRIMLLVFLGGASPRSGCLIPGRVAGRAPRRRRKKPHVPEKTPNFRGTALNLPGAWHDWCPRPGRHHPQPPHGV